jgi:predicted metal-binding membrane protein
VWLLRHDRIVVLAGLFVVIALAWLYLLLGAGIEMEQMDMGGGQIMLMSPPWTVSYALLIFFMWAIMMMAMMLPSVTPAILLAIALLRGKGTSILLPIGLFITGYLVIWTGFSLTATVLQWGLDQAGFLSANMAIGGVIAGLLLIVAGLYQWSPFKQACLVQCRSPSEHLVRYWRQGPMIAGARHGLFCLGCCWMLMALLFVGGLMNILWIAGLALFVLFEKVLPIGPRFCRVSGIALMASGAFVLLR